MNSNRLLSAVLFAAVFTTGCKSSSYEFARKDMPGTDLNDVSKEFYTSMTWSDESITYTLTGYKLSGVRYAMAAPSSSLSVSDVTNAIVVNSGALKALEFGSGTALTNTAFDPIVFLTIQAKSWSDVFSSGDNPFADGRQAYTQNAVAKIADGGNDSILGWGRWTSSLYTKNGAIQAACCSATKSAHYVFGAPTQTLPTSGTASFDLIGATSPTLSNGASSPGTLNSGVVNVAWGLAAGGSPAIGVSMAGTINGAAFTVISNPGPAGPGTAHLSSGISYNAGTQSFSSPIAMTDGSSVSGFFAGPDATHVGLSYSKPVTGGTVQGAVAFKR
jgi:hypothetical protein